MNQKQPLPPISPGSLVKLIGTLMGVPPMLVGRFVPSIVGRALGISGAYNGVPIWAVHFYIAIPEQVIGCPDFSLQLMPHDEFARQVIGWEQCCWRPIPNWKPVHHNRSA